VSVSRTRLQWRRARDWTLAYLSEVRKDRQVTRRTNRRNKSRRNFLTKGISNAILITDGAQERRRDVSHMGIAPARIWDDLTPERGWTGEKGESLWCNKCFEDGHVADDCPDVDGNSVPDTAWRAKWEKMWLAGFPKQNDMSVIVPDLLWQGAFPRDWDDIKAKGIQLIVNVSEMPHYAPPFAGEVIQWHIDDGEVPDLFVLDAVTTKVAQSIKDKKAVLTHCAMGLNRSGLVDAIALIKLTGWSGSKVIDALRTARNSDVLCNSRFEKFVREFRVRSA